jgi:hypothetical protein
MIGRGRHGGRGWERWLSSGSRPGSRSLAAAGSGREEQCVDGRQRGVKKGKRTRVRSGPLVFFLQNRASGGPDHQPWHGQHGCVGHPRIQGCLNTFSSGFYRKLSLLQLRITRFGHLLDSTGQGPTCRSQKELIFTRTVLACHIQRDVGMCSTG